MGDHIIDKEEMGVLKKLFIRSMRGIEFYGQKKNQVIRMMHELLEMRGMQSVIQLLALLEALSATKEYYHISSTAFDNRYDQSETDRMNTVYEYVLKNFRQKIELKDLADLLHMTPRHLVVISR